jgi:cation diffusion facilitator CzcD-associated flavoprotein CzcO
LRRKGESGKFHADTPLGILSIKLDVSLRTAARRQVMARVVILGAGISGHTAALHLRRLLGTGHEVVVVSPNADWNWIPSNILVGVGRMSPQQVTFPLAPVYRRQGIEFRQARAVAIRPAGMVRAGSPLWTSSSPFPAGKASGNG